MLDNKTLYINVISGEAQLGSDVLSDFHAREDKDLSFDEWAPSGFECVETPHMTRDIIENAKTIFMDANLCKVPQQLNLRCHFTEGWEVEFRECEGSFSNGFLKWLSGDIVRDIFENLNVKALQDSINAAWCDEYFDIS